MIYTTAVVFGFVSVRGVTVYGIWRGKSPEDWNRERVKLRLNRGAKQLKMEVLNKIREIVRF